MRKKIHRFPRLSEKLSRLERMRIKIELGFLPKRWRVLKPIQRRAARMYARGESTRDICEKLGIDKSALYRWINLHPKFRRYLKACAEEEIKRVPERLAGRYPRALRIIEETMESEDPYFQYQSAKDYLRGMGAYKTNVSTKQEGKLDVQIDQHVDHSLPAGMAKDFVELLLKVAGGVPAEQPKIIEHVPILEVKALPAAPGTEENAPKEVQEVQPAKAVGRNKPSQKR